MRVVLRALLADARGHKLQTLVTLLGVAVGVAVIVAIHLASEASLEHFRGTFDSVAGRATHELNGAAPLSTERLPELLREPGVIAAQPVVSRLAVAPARADRPARALRVLGLDPFLAAPFLEFSSAARAQIGSARLFERLLLEHDLLLAPGEVLADLGLPDEGGALDLRVGSTTRRVRLARLDGSGLARSDPPVLLTDLATAQQLAGLDTGLTRYDLILDPDAPPPQLAAGERLARPARRGERADSMTAAFRTNLLCLGFLAVLVGAFLAFNMAQFAVTRRRAMLGRLRCLGCSAKALQRAVLVEAALLGLAGSVFGVALGRALAGTLVGDVARTVSTLYGRVDPPGVSLDALTATAALLVGVGATVAASWGPARSAARTPPVLVAGGVVRDPLPHRALAPLLCVFAALLLCVPQSAVVLPSIAVLAILLATATAMPHLLRRLLEHPPRQLVAALAAGRLERSLARTGAAAGALAMPLAMTVALLVMVGSFRGEVVAWAEAVLGGDLYVQPLEQELAAESLRLSPALLDAMAAHPQVETVDTLRLIERATDSGELLIGGSELEAVRRRGTMRVLQGGPLSDVLTALDAGAALISEPLAQRRGLAPGDSLRLPGRDGERELTVAAVFQDFSFDRGYVLLAARTHIELFGETGVRNAAALLRPGADPEVVRDALMAAHPEVLVRTVAKLRDDVLRAFNDTFAITYVLQGISTALALVGILTALLCLHLERRHELGVLRALGARTRAIGGLLLVEAGALMFVAELVALPVGLGLAWILVAVVNTRSFGWSFPMAIDFGAVSGLLGMALVAGLLAGLVPWLLTRRGTISQLLETRR
ncbi:MAG: permease [Planctomycetota bacterium]|nr:MAG: permease [Planctomycetota bacterium]